MSKYFSWRPIAAFRVSTVNSAVLRPMPVALPDPVRSGPSEPKTAYPV